MTHKTELPDLDRLETLAVASAQHGDDIGEDEWFTADKHMKLFSGSPDLDFIAACSPVAILSLIALARRAKPEGDRTPAAGAGGQHPVEPGALAASITELDAWLETDGCEPLTVSQGESVGLVLQELKRLRAICPECKGTGMADSGGTHPWGEPALIPCGCDRAPVTGAAVQPEGEAPQAEKWQKLTEDSAINFGRLVDVVLTNGVYEYCRRFNQVDWTQVQDWRYAAPVAPAATLSPLCGAQHAESGAQAVAMPSGWAVERVGDAMHIKRADGKWCGYMAENGPAAALTFEFLRDLAAQQAAAPDWGPVHSVGDMVRNLLTLDQAAPIFTAFHVTIDGQRRCRTRGVTISKERVIDGKWIDSARKDVPYTHIIWAKTDERAPSAPGTPEAPKTARPKRLTEEEVRELALQHLHDDTESAGRNGFFTFSAEGLDGFAIDLMDSQRAAQLDGGQEGS